MMIERALAYIEAGWAVFPLIPNSKRPMTKNGFKDASKAREDVRRWWTEQPDANIGISTGEPSGLVVVDVDVKNGAKGMESLASLSGIDPTLTVKTPSGGLHLYYLTAGPTRCRTGILPGIDIKADGGYVVAPGSVIDGKPYEWDDPEAHLINLPSTVIALMADTGARTTFAPPAGYCIAEGLRNSELASIAGTMRRRGLQTDEITAALKQVNLNRCSPPLPDSEIESIAKSVCRYAPAPTTKPDSGEDEEDRPAGLTDDSLALSFSEKYWPDWRYCSAWGYWLHWDGQRWCRENTLKAFDLARAVCRKAAKACDKQPMVAKVSSANTVASVERLAKADRRHAAIIEQWDRDPWLLNTANGVIDLHSGQLRPHDRLGYLTKIAAAGLAPETEQPTRWLSFLNDITNGDTELQSYLARMAGYSLTGITSEHTFFFLYGTGANGKSVFLNTLATVLGDYGTNAAMDTFLESKSDKHPTDLAGLRGARLVTAIEVEKGRRFADAKIKSLTGGDKITARFMRQDFFEFSPQFKLVIAGNDKPYLRDVDEAMRRRLHLVPFTVTVPLEKRDHNLSEKLLAERDAILRWAVNGCLDWQRVGLNPPACVTSATGEYLESQDSLGRWIADECRVEVNASAATDELYQSWKLWAEKWGEYVGSMKRFAEALQKRGFKRSRSNKQRLFQGLALNITPI